MTGPFTQARITSSIDDILVLNMGSFSQSDEH
jgi:hypothetical protein